MIPKLLILGAVMNLILLQTLIDTIQYFYFTSILLGYMNIVDKDPLNNRIREKAGLSRRSTRALV
jgi:hypothetical protein